MSFSPFDHRCMSLALRLARKGINTTHPNPRVGCVIAKDNQICAEGWHQITGGPHAEAHALANAGNQAKGATVYVTLEPCSHQGLTPACSVALIKAGVARVVCAMQDPNPKVAGNGIKQLQSAGIEVECGLMSAAAEELNQGFIKRMRHGMPWVRVKMAQSLDGHIALANGTSQWISGPPARQDVQIWRARSDAILTGVGTVLADNPRLDVRFEGQLDARLNGQGDTRLNGQSDARLSGQSDAGFNGQSDTRFDDQSGPQLGARLDVCAGEKLRQPLRVIADSHWRTPADARLLNDDGGPVLIAGVDKHNIPEALANSVAELCPMPSNAGRVDLKALLKLLAARGINEVQVEAGAMIGGSLLSQNLIDELLIYQAPILLGGGAISPFAAPRLDNMAHRVHLSWLDTRRVGNDLRLRLRPES